MSYKSSIILKFVPSHTKTHMDTYIREENSK